jgi:hypothetical protein
MDQSIITSIVCYIPRLITSKINELLPELTNIIGNIDLNDTQIESKITLLLVKFSNDFGRDIGKFIRSILNDFPPFDIVLNIQKLTKIMITLNNYKELFKNLNDPQFITKLNNVNTVETPQNQQNPGIIKNVTDVLKTNTFAFARLIMNSFIQALLNTIGNIKKPVFPEDSAFSKMLICKEVLTSAETENTINMINNIGQDKVELIKIIIDKSLTTIMTDFSDALYNAIVDNDKIKKGGSVLRKRKGNKPRTKQFKKKSKSRKIKKRTAKQRTAKQRANKQRTVRK